MTSQGSPEITLRALTPITAWEWYHVVFRENLLSTAVLAVHSCYVMYLVNNLEYEKETSIIMCNKGLGWWVGPDIPNFVVRLLWGSNEWTWDRPDGNPPCFFPWDPLICALLIWSVYPLFSLFTVHPSSLCSLAATSHGQNNSNTLFDLTSESDE